MDEQDQLLQKVLAANDTEGIAEGERGDDAKGNFGKVRSRQLYVYHVFIANNYSRHKIRVIH